MSKIYLPLLLSTTLLTSYLYANSEEGKELFNEANCMKCHAQQHFKHKKAKVSDFHKLSEIISVCASNTDAEWFDDEVHEVAKFLNKNHYHYKDIPKKED